MSSKKSEILLKEICVKNECTVSLHNTWSTIVDFVTSKNTFSVTRRCVLQVYKEQNSLIVKQKEVKEVEQRNSLMVNCLRKWDLDIGDLLLVWNYDLCGNESYSMEMLLSNGAVLRLLDTATGLNILNSVVIKKTIDNIIEDFKIEYNTNFSLEKLVSGIKTNECVRTNIDAVPRKGFGVIITDGVIDINSTSSANYICETFGNEVYEIYKFGTHYICRQLKISGNSLTTLLTEVHREANISMYKELSLFKNKYTSKEVSVDENTITKDNTLVDEIREKLASSTLKKLQVIEYKKGKSRIINQTSPREQMLLCIGKDGSIQSWQAFKSEDIVRQFYISLESNKLSIKENDSKQEILFDEDFEKNLENFSSQLFILWFKKPAITANSCQRYKMNYYINTTELDYITDGFFVRDLVKNNLEIKVIYSDITVTPRFEFIDKNDVVICIADCSDVFDTSFEVIDNFLYRDIYNVTLKQILHSINKIITE